MTHLCRVSMGSGLGIGVLESRIMFGLGVYYRLRKGNISNS